MSFHPEIKHFAPDVLSRLETEGQDETDLKDDIPVLSLTKADSKTLETFRNNDEAMEYRKYLLPKNFNIDPISKTILLEEQSTDSDSQRYASFVPKANVQSTYNNDGDLVQISRLDVEPQRIVPVSFRKRVLYLSPYHGFQGHPVANLMYNTLRSG